MNTELTRREIGRLLDSSTGELPPAILHGLHAARRRALARQRASQAGDNDTSLLQPRFGPQAQQRIFAAVVAILLLINLQHWYRHDEREQESIDIAILTDDLPVHIYVD